MRKPFEPELSSATLAAANLALADPRAAKGKATFESQSCNACHGDGVYSRGACSCGDQRKVFSGATRGII